jgi:hypothetical protein
MSGSQNLLFGFLMLLDIRIGGLVGSFCLSLALLALIVRDEYRYEEGPSPCLLRIDMCGVDIEYRELLRVFGQNTHPFLANWFMIQFLTVFTGDI